MDRALARAKAGRRARRRAHPNEAIAWAREVAETGRTVDVIRKRRFPPSRTFITAFPESEYAARKAAWSMPWIGDGGAFGG